MNDAISLRLFTRDRGGDQTAATDVRDRTASVMLAHLGAATGTNTSAFALQAGVSIPCRTNVSFSRVIRPAPGSVPNFGNQMRASRESISRGDNRAPKKQSCARTPVAGGEQPLAILPLTGER